MLKALVKRVVHIMNSPIRYAIRSELRNISRLNSKNIEMSLQYRAVESSAKYVEEHMKNVNSTSSNIDLLTMAMEKADFDNKLVCEFGVYSGSTINHIASRTIKTIYGFDSFEGLPERWRDGFDEGHFKVNSLPKVPSNVVLIKGWFDDSIPEFIKNHKEDIGFLHIDCDLYSSTSIIFQLLSDRIRPGCVIVFDEYFNYPSWEEGEYKAFHEFLKKVNLNYKYIGYNRHHEQVAVIIKAVN